MNRSALVLNTSQIKTRRVVFLYQSLPFLLFILSPSYDASLCCAAPSTRSDSIWFRCTQLLTPDITRRYESIVPLHRSMQRTACSRWAALSLYSEITF